MLIRLSTPKIKLFRHQKVFLFTPFFLDQIYLLHVSICLINLIFGWMILSTRFTWNENGSRYLGDLLLAHKRVNWIEWNTRLRKIEGSFLWTTKLPDPLIHLVKLEVYLVNYNELTVSSTIYLIRSSIQILIVIYFHQSSANNFYHNFLSKNLPNNRGHTYNCPQSRIWHGTKTWMCKLAQCMNNKRSDYNTKHQHTKGNQRPFVIGESKYNLKEYHYLHNIELPVGLCSGPHGPGRVPVVRIPQWYDVVAPSIQSCNHHR